MTAYAGPVLFIHFDATKYKVNSGKSPLKEDIEKVVVAAGYKEHSLFSSIDCPAPTDWRAFLPRDSEGLSRYPFGDERCFELYLEDVDQESELEWFNNKYAKAMTAIKEFGESTNSIKKMKVRWCVLTFPD